MMQAPEFANDPMEAKRRRTAMFSELAGPSNAVGKMPSAPGMSTMAPAGPQRSGPAGQVPQSMPFGPKPGGLPGMPTMQSAYPQRSGPAGQMPMPAQPFTAKPGGLPGTPEISPAGGPQRQPPGSAAWQQGQGSFQDWFMSQVANRPYNQQTLLDLEAMLQQSGSKLTPANASGERTKIWDPSINDWVRVGFGEGKPVWIPQGWGANGPQNGGAGAGASAGSGAGVSAGSGGGAGGDFNSSVRQMLMQQLGQMGQTPGADDPIIANQVNAYRREKERSGQQSRAALAERAAASGLNSGGAGSGAFDTGIAGIHEGIGEDVGQFSAGAVGKELYNRRDKMTQLLSMAVQTGDNDLARSLQMEIARMDNQLRQATLGENRRQFDQGLGENRRQFDDQFGRSLGRDAESDQRWRLEFGY